MIVCYLDDSDATISKAMTIAGYVAQEEGWHRFEAQAAAICDKYEVTLIRGREIDGRKDSFKGWKLPKIEMFLEEIGQSMAENVLFGISRSIGKTNYKVRQRQLKLHPNLSAFGYCFGTISFTILNDEGRGLKNQARAEGVAYMLESGGKNNGDILRYVSEERDHGNLHLDTTVTEVGKRSCWAIQIADLYAFYSRRRANKYARFKGKLEFVKDLHQLHVQPKIPHLTGFIEEPYTEATNQRTGEHFFVQLPPTDF